MERRAPSKKTFPRAMRPANTGAVSRYRFRLKRCKQPPRSSQPQPPVYMSILVTGAAGFIGSHVVRALLVRGETVLGIDNFSDYYDPVLKFARLKPLREIAGFTFFEADIADREAMHGLTGQHRGIDRIVHLAAQPGVRHSLV